ncbi:hypothetical protein LTR56_028032, partial [Elasticomyces elasticus]
RSAVHLPSLLERSGEDRAAAQAAIKLQKPGLLQRVHNSLGLYNMFRPTSAGIIGNQLASWHGRVNNDVRPPLDRGKSVAAVRHNQATHCITAGNRIIALLSTYIDRHPGAADAKLIKLLHWLSRIQQEMHAVQGAAHASVASIEVVEALLDAFEGEIRQHQHSAGHYSWADVLSSLDLIEYAATTLFPDLIPRLQANVFQRLIRQ